MKVSVIILNYNGKEHLKRCLSSIFNQNYKDFEVIFVDNASTDNSVDFVKRNFKKAKIIQNKTNLVYAEGNNVGIRNSKGKYVVIMNNDTKADKNFLKELVKVADSKKEIGMVSPKMLFLNKKIDSLGLKVYKSGLTDDIKKENNIFCPCGGAVLYKKRMLEDIKLGKDYFDSDYLIYAEDFDLGFRANLKGWKCAYAKNAIIYHIHGATMKKKPNFSIYLGDRNRIWTIIKDYPTILLIKYLPQILLLQIASIIKYTLKGKPHIIFKSKFDALMGLPKTLKKRKIIQKNKKISIKELDKLFTKRLFY